MAEYSYCVNSNHIPQELLCDTDHYFGNNSTTTIAVDNNANVTPKTQSLENGDLTTPRLCNKVDNTTDLDIDRSNNRIFDRLQNEINILDINKNKPGIKIDISEDSDLGSGENSVNSAGEGGKVRFGLNSYEEYDASPDSEKTILDDNTLKMEDNVFKQEFLTKAKSESQLDNYYLTSVSKVRKISPSGLTSPSSTTSLSADLKSVCRRKHSSGSDTGRRSQPVSEEIFGIDDEVSEDELPPCDCDECLFNPVEERPKPPPEERMMTKKV